MSGRPLDSLALQVLAGGQQPGANAYQLGAGPSWSILLDAGSAHAGASAPTLARAPQQLWLSHAHADHASWAPALWAQQPGLKALATPQTASLLAALWRTTLPGRQRARAEALAAQVTPLPTRSPRLLWRDDALSVTATSYPSGHAFGAASLLLDMASGQKFRRVLYLSDFCPYDLPLVPGALLPKLSWQEGQLDVLIMEGALAQRAPLDDLDWDAQLERLLAYLAPCAQRRPRLAPLAPLGLGASLVHALAPLDPVVHESLAALALAQGASVRRQGTLAQCREALAAGQLVLASGAQLEPGSPAALLWPEAQLRGARVALINASQHRASALIERSPRITAQGFSLPDHAPPWALRATVRALAPRALVLVHGTRQGLMELRRALRADGYQGSLWVPKTGQRVELGHL